MTTSDTSAQRTEELSGEYQLDPAHTTVGFVARHAMVTKVRGRFQEFSGRLDVDQNDPSRASAEVTVEVRSLTTGNEQRDAHLLGSDFFDVERYPTLSFISREVDRIDDRCFRVRGDLTIKDQTHPVDFDLEAMGSAKDPYGNLRVGFEARAEISRKDWGLSWNVPLETGGFLVSDRVRLQIDISAVKLTPPS